MVIANHNDDDGYDDGDDDDTVQLETMRRSSVYQDYLRPAKVDSLIQKYAYNLTVGDQVSGGRKYYACRGLLVFLHSPFSASN